MKLNERKLLYREAYCKWLDGHLNIMFKYQDVTADTDDDYWIARMYAKLMCPEVEIVPELIEYFNEMNELLESVKTEFGLTPLETLSLYSGQIRSIIKYRLRDEHHGDVNKPGGTE
jgi:hypothetical protein